VSGRDTPAGFTQIGMQQPLFALSAPLAQALFSADHDRETPGVNALRTTAGHRAGLAHQEIQAKRRPCA
jgi:hypothetical protein